MKIFDCTLRDGGNVVGKGFDKELTISMIEGLISTGIEDIEYGHCTGINSTLDDNSNAAPLTDDQYLELAKDYIDKANLGMFVGWKNCSEEACRKAKNAGLKFLRIGINAGDFELAKNTIKVVKNAGLECKISMMKAYVLNPQELAEEALKMEKEGADHIIIMDSAGYMLPSEVEEYVKAFKEKIKVKFGFHGHNNLGLASGNAIAAINAGVDTIDTGLLGMARSAGNISTELIVSILERLGMNGYDFKALLSYLDKDLVPKMLEKGYQSFVRPLDIVLGYSGCHSSFVNTFKEVSMEKKVDLYDLIIETSKINQKNPSRELMEEVASNLDKELV